jgi:hypothetical protein
MSAEAPYRAGRLVWWWCVAYTSVAPRESRERRRGEMRSHLWECERARLRPAAVAFAALRGAGSDLAWAVTCGVPQLVRSFGTPTPYIVLAPLFPIQAWIVSAVTLGSTASIAEGVGSLGGGLMLALAGGVWLLRRASNRRGGGPPS